MRRQNRKKNNFEFDITPILDIFAILLIFTLQNYSSAGIVPASPKGVDLPRSTSESLNTHGVNIQVSKSHILVNEKEVMNIESIDVSQIYEDEGKRIAPLYKQLLKQKEDLAQAQKLSPQVKPFSGVANLIIDKSIKYSYVKKIMYTCAKAGFTDFKFVVLAEK